MERVSYSNCFGDKRLDTRGEALHAALFQHGTRSIKAVSKDWSEQKSNYRFLHSEKTTEQKLIKHLSQRCAQAVRGRLVLAIQDSSEVDLCAHVGRLHLEHTGKDSGLGSIDNNRGGIGFKLHPCLVVDAQSCFPLGYSHIRIWHRPIEQGNKHQRNYSQLSIEQKESYKWIDCSEKTKEVLSQAEGVILVQDREGDIFEQLYQIPDHKTFLLIRSFTNRTTVLKQKLWTVLEQSPLLGQYALDVPLDSHNKQPARVASIEVRAVCVDIKAPLRNSKNKGQTVTLYALEAREVNTTVKEPILWRLLTTWPVHSYEEALRIIEWYSWRWFIEEVFRILKKGGFDIEASELQSGWAIRKLTIMLLDVIVKLMQLHQAYNEPEQANVPQTALVFNEKEQECLNLINNQVQGRTQALNNPYPSQKLNHAAWIIARLGGWKGYKSQQPPGMLTLLRGLIKFYDIFEGWSLQLDVGTR